MQQRIQKVAPLLVLVLVVVAMMSPVLVDGRPGILDAPIICSVCRATTWHEPAQLLNIMGFGNQARPLQFLAFLPAFFSKLPIVYHVFQNGVLLLLTCVMAFRIISFFIGNQWLTLVAVFCALVTASFTSNYYVLWTMEPYMLFGMYGVLFVLVRLTGTPVLSRGAWWWYNGVGVVCAMYAIGVKEPGVMAYVVCVAAGLLLVRLGGLGWRTGLQRCWPVAVGATLVAVLVIVVFLTNKGVYDASGTGGYSLALTLLQESVGRFARHFVDTAPHALLAVPAWIFVVLMYEVGKNNEQERQALRAALTGAGIFFVIAVGMAAIYVPWQVFDTRYLLLSSSSAVMATVLTIYALSVVLRMRIHALWQLVTMSQLLLLSTLLVLHVLFTLAIGPLSRGLVSHKFACAYDDMFRYVAAQTPSNGTAYFIMNSKFAEPIENARLGMRLFYDRPDIYCAFPQTPVAFLENGLVAVTSLKDFAFNYSRMPVHAGASAKFRQMIRNDVRFVLVTAFVYRTSLLYVRDEYNVPQYKAWWGIPAFWELRRGVYHFGWNVYRFAGSGAARQAATTLAACGEDIVRDGSFARGWQCWEAQDARMTQAIAMVAADAPGAGTALRLKHLRGPMLHVRQLVRLDAGNVYRLSAVAKMVAPAYPEVLGARLAVFTPDRREVGVAWDYVRPNEWERQHVVFTNAVSGGAVVYVELSSRSGARTALVTEVRLERVAR